jgi:hypothetical protein
MNAKSVEEIAVVLRRMWKARDRIDGYRPLVVDLVRELSLGDPVTPQRVAEIGTSRGTPLSTVEEIGRSAEWSNGSIVGLNGLTSATAATACTSTTRYSALGVPGTHSSRRRSSEEPPPLCRPRWQPTAQCGS